MQFLLKYWHQGELLQTHLPTFSTQYAELDLNDFAMTKKNYTCLVKFFNLQKI